jgi:hypothetical protein
MSQLANRLPEHNAICDAVPDLSESMQLDWDTLEIPNFYEYLESVKKHYTHAKFSYPVYNPCHNTVNVAADWGQACTTQDRDLALAQPFSIAAMRVFYDEPWVFDFDPEVARIDVTQFDLVLLSDIEYYSQKQIQEWAAKKGIKRYLLALGGLNHETVDTTTTLYRPYWIKVYTEKNTPGIVDGTSKPYVFDCMLGARRPHRDYVMLALTQTRLLEKSIVTYRDCFPGSVVNEHSQQYADLFPDITLNWPYVSPNLDPAWEVSNHINNQISFVSPNNIFQQTNYSIITETIGTGENFFLSEKTIKAINAKRVFVVFGPRYYLRRLREHGFQTFDTVIDESYDNEPIDAVRFQLAMLQLLRLAYFESVEMVYATAKHALDSNVNTLSWICDQYREKMNDLLISNIPADHITVTQDIQ